MVSDYCDLFLCTSHTNDSFIAKPIYGTVLVPIESLPYFQPQVQIPVPVPMTQIHKEKVSEKQPEADYWAWETEKTIVSKQSTITRKSSTNERRISTTVVTQPTQSKTGRKKRVMKKDKFAARICSDADRRIIQLAEWTAGDSVPIIQKGDKPARTEDAKHPEKRSEYIGVSKNGKNWQALVVIDSEKVYMGSFKTQEEAALVYDLYSIIVNYKDAKANKPYTVREVQKLLYFFKKNNYKFNPTEYLNQ